jgi:hypothetical protein
MAALAAAVVVLVVVGLVAASIGFGGRGRSSAPPSTAQAPIKRVVADIERFVVATRHHDFKHAVPVTFLDDRRFRARLLADAAKDKADIETSAKVLRAVGLLTKGDDLYASVLRFVGDAVVGFYDPKSGDLVLRGTAVTPYVRTTLAHELTHALDDQWFGLDRPALAHSNSEASLAFTSLAEGNAVRVEDAYRATMSAADQSQAKAEEQQLAGSIDVSHVPRVVQEEVIFPYVSGPPFVRALLASGGEARVDAAFARPPTTSEDILDPKEWLAGHEALQLPRPKADGTVIDKGIYGRSSLVDTLEPVVGTAEATRVAGGWNGDGYVAWDAGRGSTCVRATFATDTPAELDDLTASMRTWATEQGASVERAEGTVTFTACG